MADKTTISAAGTWFSAAAWEQLAGHTPASLDEPVLEGLRVPLLFLDLDGTVRKGYDELGRFVNGPEDVEVFPEAVTMMRKWREEKGGRIAGVSNQGGVALGFVTLQKCVEAMHETAAQADGLFDTILFCMHHPGAAELELQRCWCRKPAPGMLIEAAASLSYQHHEVYPPGLALMVGDREEDAEAAHLANVDMLDARDWLARGEAAFAPPNTTEENA